jgi:hypothetical protein
LRVSPLAKFHVQAVFATIRAACGSILRLDGDLNLVFLLSRFTCCQSFAFSLFSPSISKSYQMSAKLSHNASKLTQTLEMQTNVKI